MRQYMSYRGETLYIGGPSCFYTDGYPLWHSCKGQAEFLGFRVTMPTDNVLDLTHEDLRLNAKEIFDNCEKAMLDATAMLADLEAFRGTEPDGGTLFEIGMAYARNLRIVAHTRDRRSMIHKVRGAQLVQECVVDAAGKPLPYGAIPFCPMLMHTAYVVEGDFQSALRMLQAQIDYAKRQLPCKGMETGNEVPAPCEKNTVFLFSHKVYEPDATSWFEQQKQLWKKAGYTLFTPLDDAKGEREAAKDDPLAQALQLAARWENHVRACQRFVVDLNDFNGYEPSGDAAVLAGFAWQLGKQCVGYMDDTRCMRERIPHYGPEQENKDQFGNDVENFNYPINLMFSASMPIIQGGPEQALAAWSI